MELYKDKLKNVHGYNEGGMEAVDAESSAKAIDYKKNICKNYISLNPDQVDIRLGGSVYYVTRKYDGELNIIFYNGTDTILINRSGKVRSGLPCLEEAGKLLKAAGINQAMIPAELYVNEEKGRTRVFDVLADLADDTLISGLNLAPFDIVGLNGIFKANSYEETYNKLKEIFGRGELCKPVRYQKVTSKSEVKSIYSKWVEDEGSEGLVVRSELPLVFKIKPRYSIDVAIIGFSEGTGDQKGQIRSFLLALMPEEGQYQVVGRTGNGFSDELKKELLTQFTPKIIESQYIETDSNHVAFHMVTPDTVIELNINDVLFESTSGTILNPILEIVNGKYILHSSCNGISLVYPIFERFRTDKTVNASDIRLSQISDFQYISELNNDSSPAEMPKSEILMRKVYKKATDSKIMVQKFMIWKTNKEKFSNYPAYVFHYTNFSSDRKEPLQRDIRVSNDYGQIEKLAQGFIDDNVKKGWVLQE